MILVDISGVLHKAAYNSTKDIPAQEEIIQPEKYKRFFIDYILSDLIEVNMLYGRKYGDMVICFDYKGFDSYWRKDIYPDYKGQRKALKQKQKFDYNDVYDMFNELKKQLEKNTPWKCITVDRAEADDIILVLARTYGSKEKTLIYSADKDMIQAQFNNPLIEQYSHQTKKWLVPEDKHDNMEHWFLEHQCLGDTSDNVFHIMTNTEFSKKFSEHLDKHNIPIEFHSVWNFRNGYRDDGNIQELSKETKMKVLSSFKEYKKLKANQEVPTLDVYKDIRFGPSTLCKSIEKFGSLDKMIDSNPCIRENYERNYKLVMEQGIPEYIWKNIVKSYNVSETTYNEDEFNEYLDSMGLYHCKMDFQKIFNVDVEEISIDNCGW